MKRYVRHSGCVFVKNAKEGACSCTKIALATNRVCPVYSDFAVVKADGKEISIARESACREFMSRMR